MSRSEVAVQLITAGNAHYLERIDDDVFDNPPPHHVDFVFGCPALTQSTPFMLFGELPQ